MSAECSAGNIPPGYKQTEVGVIPEDWKLTNLSFICKEPMQNGVFYKPSLKGVGIKLINVGDLYTRTPIDSDTLELFNASDKERERFKVEDGDLFFTRSSVVPSGIAHCNIYSAPEPEPVVFDSHVIRLRPDTKKVVPSYLFRFCVAKVARHYLVSHAKTATMTTIDQRVLGKCPVILPPITEQESIAEALSDADAFIESLEQLIAKKRQIKQGVMQELLTGKRRLPGFEIKKGYKHNEVGVIPKDWEVKQLGDISTIATGNTPPTRDPTNYGDEFMFVSPIDLGFSKYVSHTEKMLSKKGFSISRSFPAGSVLFVCIGSTIGKCGIAPETLTSNQQINAILPSEEMSCDYLYYAVSSVASKVKSLAGEQAVPIVNKTLFSETTIPIPPTKAEQEAIAIILSDMDSEITALEEKLAKVRQIKQGMMQELLTGRIRLI